MPGLNGFIDRNEKTHASTLGAIMIYPSYSKNNTASTAYITHSSNAILVLNPVVNEGYPAAHCVDQDVRETSCIQRFVLNQHMT